MFHNALRAIRPSLTLEGAIEETLEGFSTTHTEPLKMLMTFNLQQFEDVVLVVASGRRCVTLVRTAITDCKIDSYKTKTNRKYSGRGRRKAVHG